MKVMCEICDFVFSEYIEPKQKMAIVQMAEQMRAHYYMFHNPERVKLMEDKK